MTRTVALAGRLNPRALAEVRRRTYLVAAGKLSPRKARELVRKAVRL